ncbi:MAG: CCA tRNA nucleotidyltransferase [Candidatus ainarchaeum sp.]|nr:CCA tRNA nucleotidyltransferase [Candidatus ainarchaeum sp.]
MVQNLTKKIQSAKTLINLRKKIYFSVLKKVVPTKSDLLKEKKLFLEIEKKVLSIEGKHSHIEWCGSSARNTHLKNDRDLDLFIMFDRVFTEEELEGEGLRVAAKVFGKNKYEKAYSQHPYLRGKIKGFDVELVPSYKMNSGEKIKSAVDRTSLHNKFLTEKLSLSQKNEIRLLKQFLKGINAYGADLKNCSLPGYGAELLIYYYGDFEKTIKAISNWKEKETIIPFKTKSKLNLSIFKEPLILIDPVDENRNVASALSKENYDKMIYASKLFLANPTINFFFNKKQNMWPVSKIRGFLSKKELICVKAFFPKSIIEDLMWGQFRKFLKKISHFVKENDFVIENSKIFGDGKEVYFLFQFESLTIQSAKKLIGPKFDDLENIKRFLLNKKVISGPRIENDKIVIEIERKYTSLIELFKLFLKEKMIEEKDGVVKAFKKAKILNEKEIIEEYSKNKEFGKFLINYLIGKESFE